MIKKLQKKYALSEQGAKDLIKGCLACVPVSYTHLDVYKRQVLCYVQTRVSL